MTEEAPATPRVKRPYVRRDTRQADVRAEPARPEPVRAKTRTRRGTFQNIYGIDKSILEAIWATYGADLQWNLDTVKGANGNEVYDLPFTITRVGMEQQGWESVMPGMFGGMLDGLFTKQDHKGEIIVGGQVLQWRPRELTEEARAEERQAAKQAIGVHEKQIQSGSLPGVDANVFNPRHGSAQSVSRLTKSRVPSIPVPQ